MLASHLDPTSEAARTNREGMLALLAQLEEAQAEALEQKLGQLGREASGDDPVKTWEALDHLEDAVDKAAKAAAESAVAESERLARAEALSEALSEGLKAGVNQMDLKLMTEAMQTLSGMIKDAIDENMMLSKSLSPELQEALKSGALKPKDLKALSEALKQNRSALNQKLSKLSRAGMIDGKSIQGAVQASRRGNSELSQFLKENAKRISVKDAVEAWCSGKGGVDRGRGDARGRRPNGACGLRPVATAATGPIHRACGTIGFRRGNGHSPRCAG